jgi:2,5-dihydroxypyridine 5,6-dioxygenase
MSSEHRLRELPGFLEAVLALSNVREGERVALITTHRYVPSILDSYRVALSNLGADFLRLVLPPRVRGQGPGLDNPMGPFATDILKSADMIVRPLTVWPPGASDISMYSDVFRETLFSGTRWLDVMIDEMSMRRLMPSPEMIQRSQTGVELMEKVESIRITSPAGTDLTMTKKGRKGHLKTGRVLEPGAWDNFGFGAVSTAVVEDSAEGTLVFDRGDSLGFLLGTLNDFCVDPVYLDFRDGEVIDIRGEVTAQVLRNHLDEIDRPEFYRIAHFGWGTQDKAVWGGSNFTVADWESFYGSIILHFGHNTFDTPARFSGFGGSLEPSKPWPLPHHTGGTLLNHDMYLDGELVIKQGKIIVPELA